MSFQVGEHILLNVPSIKGVMSIYKKVKRSPRHIGLFEVLDNVGPLVYIDL